MLSRHVAIRLSPWLLIAAAVTVLASSAQAQALDPGAPAQPADLTSPMAAAQAEEAETNVSSVEMSLLRPRQESLGGKVRRLRIAGWTTFSAGWVFFGVGFAAVFQGSMEDDYSRWLLRVTALESVAFVLLTTGGALLLRARLIVWRTRRSERSFALSASPSGFRATWSF